MQGAIFAFPIYIKLPPIRNSEKIERRTSNIERPILMALRFIDFKTSEPKNPENNFTFFDFFKLTEYIIRRSLFDVHFLVNS